MTRFRGVLVPLLTPFDAAGELDERGLRDHLDTLIEAGVHGVIPAGSTGEAMSLSSGEYRHLVATVIDHVAGRVPVIAGCSANATRQVIENCRFAEDAGADGIMLVHPFYSMPDPDELVTHYRLVADAVQLPIVIYNNPFTTSVDATPDVLARLAGVPHIDYVKESSGDSTRVLRIRELSGGKLDVLSGSDNQALEHFACGAIGWVAGAANVIPAQCVVLYELAVERHDYVGALEQYTELFPLMHLAESTGKFVQVNKAAVALAGRSLGDPRPPLLPLPDALRADVAHALDRALAAPARQESSASRS